MARWFSLESADADLFTSAPHVFVYVEHFAAPPQRVWESLASDESIKAWTSSISSLRWTCPPPRGLGATREVGLGPSKVHERFFRWDEGRGYAFYVYEANSPLFRRFGEDYVLEPDGDGTRFTWTVAIEPRPALRLPFKALAPVLKAAFGRVPGEGKRYFANSG